MSLWNILIILIIIALFFALFGTWGGPGWGIGVSWGPLGVLIVILAIVWLAGELR